MGYTHYWYRSQLPVDPAAWQSFISDCLKVCKAIAIPLGNGSGEGKPQFGMSAIIFNGHVDSGSMMPSTARVDGLKWPEQKAEGVAGWQSSETESGSWFAGPVVNTRVLPENGNGSYETFSFSKQPKEFDCCKTNYHPYDLCVQCCLIVAKEYFGEQIKVKSDGDNDAWKEAADICQHVLGYGLMFSLDSGDFAAEWSKLDHAAKEADRISKYGDYPPPPTDRDDTIKRIRKALRQRTGKAWSVRGGRGTAWGWIDICSPPRRLVNGEMTEADRNLLADALGIERIHCQGESIPSSSGHYTEYVDRAEGREPRTFGKQYWD